MWSAEWGEMAGVVHKARWEGLTREGTKHPEITAPFQDLSTNS